MEHTETITSDHGTDHVYTVILHPAEEGVAILQKLLKVVAAIAPPIVDGVMAGGATGDALDLDAQINVTGESVGRALGTLASELIAVGGVAFAKEILKYTTRRTVEGTEVAVVASFGATYQGNYGEMVKAITCALRANFGPSLRANLGAVNTSPVGSFLNKLQG